MRALVEEAGHSFDYVIVDLPPLGPVVDVRAAAQQFDAFLLVVEWGRTPRALAQDLLSDEALFNKCVGVIYNKVDIDRVNSVRELRINGLLLIMATALLSPGTRLGRRRRRPPYDRDRGAAWLASPMLAVRRPRRPPAFRRAR